MLKINIEVRANHQNSSIMEKRVRNATCPHCGNIGNTEGNGFDIPSGFGVSKDSIPLSCKICGRITYFHKKKKKRKLMNFSGKTDEIWQKYLRMKRNRDINLSAYINDESVKRVIEKKDFEVYMGKSSNLYHKRNCGYLSRSRVLKNMTRSDAILRGYDKCNACIKEYDLGVWGICLVIIIIIIMVWALSFSFS